MDNDSPCRPLRLAALHLGVCLPLRGALSATVAWLSLQHAQNRVVACSVGAVLLTLCAGTLLTAAMDPPRGRLGGTIWWQSYRTLHGLLYYVTAILAFVGVRGYGAPLLVDFACSVLIAASHYLSIPRFPRASAATGRS